MGKSERVEDRNPFTQRVVEHAINARLHTQTPLLYTVDIRLQKFKVKHKLNSTTDLQIVGNRKTELQILPKISLIKILDNMFAKMDPDFIA
jgi:hypothetical protein